MKKLLAIVFVLAMLIAPIGATLSFASEGKNRNSAFGRLMKKDKVEQINLQIGTDPNGEIMFGSFVVGELGCIVRVFKVPTRFNVRFDEAFGISNKLKEWKRGEIGASFNFTKDGNIVACARYYNWKGICIKECSYRCALRNDKCRSFYKIEDRLIKVSDCLIKSVDDTAFLSAEERLAVACECLADNCEISFSDDSAVTSPAMSDSDV